MAKKVSPNSWTSPVTGNYPIVISNEEVLLSVQNKKQEVVFSIHSNGDITYINNGKLSTVTSDNDLSLSFCLMMSELLGIQFKSKEEIISIIISNYRSNKLNNILKWVN